MKLKVFRALWGMPETDIEEVVKKVEDAGYDGLEAGSPYDEKKRDTWKEAFAKTKLEYISQLWTRAPIGVTPPGEGVPLTPDQHIETMKIQIDTNLDMEPKPLYIDGQMGRDYFSFEDNAKLMDATNNYAKEKNVKICFETHRCCFSFTPFIMRPFLQKFPWMRVTADFSNWCCACESMLEGQEADIDLAISRVDHIHARVGYEHGPQIPDPRAPEWQGHIERHVGWWEKIIEQRKQSGADYQVITPEFGPAGYMHTMPFTNVPVTDNWDINLHMKELVLERFGREI